MDEGDKAARTRMLFWIRICLLFLCIAAAYLTTAYRTPVCLRENRVNGHARMKMDRQLARVLRSLPEKATVLAYTGAHSGAFQFAAFPLRQTINEGNFVIWDASLAHPANAADYVIASDGDPVSEAIARHPEGLRETATIVVEGQPKTVVYRTVVDRQ